jgi:hypothetical protein
MSHPTERREYPRAQAKWAVTLLVGRTQIEGVIENYTPEGLFISCDQFPQTQVGHTVGIEGSFRMVIKIPGRPTMNAAGKVMWSTIRRARVGVGTQFTEISEADLQYLCETMKEYHAE